jgi:protein phosphatase PTC6
LTVVRIPLRSAKHHFGVSMSRGTRPYNEDAFQAGVIEMPAFARRGPISLTRSRKTESEGEGTGADSASGDPQVFYFGVFDGHGGAECSGFLRENLHGYIEDSAKQFELGSSLKNLKKPTSPDTPPRDEDSNFGAPEDITSQRLESPSTSKQKVSLPEKRSAIPLAKEEVSSPPPSVPSLAQDVNKLKVLDLEHKLVTQWKELVGGYFRRFRPEFFSLGAGGSGHSGEREAVMGKLYKAGTKPSDDKVGIESVLMYAFLKADLDFISAQLTEKNEDQAQAEKALNEGDILGEPSKIRGQIGGVKRFKGGSTCSTAMISTPTPTPFWHPASPCSVVISHVGDTRILLCSTSTGAAIPLTTNHHPSSPLEARRLRRYAATFVTDSFGEERMSGLANTRAFGDIQSKRIGVSAEPELRRLEVCPAEYSFMVLVSDGISGSMSDQEIVDIVKEARTPDQGAKDVVGFATEVSKEGDNATCLVVRFGGWERRIEGGLGAMGTKEVRDWRRQEATDPRSRRT